MMYFLTAGRPEVTGQLTTGCNLRICDLKGVFNVVGVVLGSAVPWQVPSLLT